MTIAFRVMGVPQTKGSMKGFVGRSKKTWKPCAFLTNDNPKNASWAETVAWEACLAARKQGIREATDGAVHLQLTFYLKRPKRPKHASLPITKPDLDKITRSIMDSLKVGGIYRDDAQVVSMSLRKLFAVRNPGVEIRVDSIEHALSI